MNEKGRFLMTTVLIAFVGGFAVGVLGAVAFTVYLGAKVGQETTNPLRAAADWSDATIWEVVAGDQANCSQFAHRMDLTGTRTLRTLGVPQCPGAVIVPAQDVATAATHFRELVAKWRSAAADDVVVPANERRPSNTYALALAVSKPPVDTHAGAAEREISPTQPESTISATRSPRTAPLAPADRKA
jgi:hypothetical protein